MQCRGCRSSSGLRLSRRAARTDLPPIWIVKRSIPEVDSFVPAPATFESEKRLSRRFGLPKGQLWTYPTFLASEDQLYNYLPLWRAKRSIPEVDGLVLAPATFAVVGLQTLSSLTFPPKTLTTPTQQK